MLVSAVNLKQKVSIERTKKKTKTAHMNYVMDETIAGTRSWPKNSNPDCNPEGNENVHLPAHLLHAVETPVRISPIRTSHAQRGKKKLCLGRYFCADAKLAEANNSIYPLQVGNRDPNPNFFCAKKSVIFN
jgi:hypothetical protein